MVPCQLPLGAMLQQSLWLDGWIPLKLVEPLHFAFAQAKEACLRIFQLLWTHWWRCRKFVHWDVDMHFASPWWHAPLPTAFQSLHRSERKTTLNRISKIFPLSSDSKDVCRRTSDSFACEFIIRRLYIEACIVELVRGRMYKESCNDP